MTDVKKEVKKLYKDALYFHLMRDGYATKQAKLEIKKIFDNK